MGRHLKRQLHLGHETSLDNEIPRGSAASCAADACIPRISCDHAAGAQVFWSRITTY
jgi:hypothetical protein